MFDNILRPNLFFPVRTQSQDDSWHLFQSMTMPMGRSTIQVILRGLWTFQLIETSACAIEGVSLISLKIVFRRHFLPACISSLISSQTFTNLGLSSQYVFSCVICFRFIHFILNSTVHALFLTCLPVSIYGT